MLLHLATAMALTSLPRPQRLPQTSSSTPRRAQHRAPVPLLKWLRLLQALTAPALLVLTRRRSLLSATLSSSRPARRCAQQWTAPQQGLVLFSRHKAGTSAFGVLPVPSSPSPVYSQARAAPGRWGDDCVLHCNPLQAELLRLPGAMPHRVLDLKLT